jgi:pimeloyl-ACP methyl ester carboxylesterase
MKWKLFFSAFFLVMLLPGLFSSPSDADAYTCEEDFSGESGAAESHIICEDETWSRGTEHVFDRPVLVVGEATITIEPGVKVYFKRGRTMPGFSIRDGVIDAVGTESDPIVFAKKEADDSFSIEFSNMNGNESLFRYVHIMDGGAAPYDTDDGSQQGFFRNFLVPTAYAMHIPGVPTLSFDHGKLAIEYSAFSGSRFADIHTENSGVNWSEWDEGRWVDDSSLHVSDTNFDGDTNIPAFTADRFACPPWESSCESKIVLSNDWYGSANGPNASDNPGGTGKAITRKVKLDGWSTSRFSDAGASNVFFLPGIKASRLYKDDGRGGKDHLWLPTIFSNDMEDLALNDDGKSVNAVYTNDVMDTTPAGDLYASFIRKLEDMKSDGSINKYAAFAYDWRQNVEDVVANGTPYPGGVMMSVVTQVVALAHTSKSGKVTIVAHSNGGLLAKALMMELEREGKADLVDTVALVGSPQMGTPMSILSLLYGYDEELLGGALVSQSEARTLVGNMPGAYGLLPSKTYLERSADPLVTFTSTHTRYQAFRDAYGEGIGDAGEFARFLTAADDKRAKPAASNVDAENVLRKNLIDAAEVMHDRIDQWIPPESVNVVEIGGWGLDTISGVELTEKKRTHCDGNATTPIPVCVGVEDYEPIYDPKFTVDGDKVVTTPSSLMMLNASNVKRYWVDLYAYNKTVAKSKSHKDILEADPVELLISNIIVRNNSALLPDYIKTSRPDDYEKAKPRIRMALYSPLDIHLYDSLGNHTGTKTITVDGHEQTVFEENIPNSYYYQFGDRKYVGFGGGNSVRVEMDGYALGSYTLKLSEVKPTATGEETIAHTTFADLPTTADTAVTFAIPSVGLSSMSSLTADTDGDGSSDYVIAPIPDGTATLSPQDVSTGGSGRSGGKGESSKKSVKKLATGTASPDEVRPALAGRLFPDPETYSRSSDILERERSDGGPIIAGESDEVTWPVSVRISLGIALVSVLLSGVWFSRRFIRSKS